MEHFTEVEAMKILIASDGMETRVLLNGVQIPLSEKSSFQVCGGESPALSVDSIPIAYKADVRV